MTAQKISQNLDYMHYMKTWTTFYAHRDYAGGAKYFASLPAWVKARYSAGNPKYGGGSSGGSSAYSKAMGTWIGLLKANKQDEAKKFFDSMPQAFRDRYYAKHPDQRLRNDVKRTGQLAEYFNADDANRIQYLKDNPEFAKWLAKNDTSAAQHKMLVTQAYMAIPKTDAWLRRIFRDRFPEVFSSAGTGVSSLKNTYAALAAHGEIIPSFNEWVKAIWDSYAENAKHTKGPGRAVKSDHSLMRQHGTTRKVQPHSGKSAAWVRLHSV